MGLYKPEPLVTTTNDGLCPQLSGNAADYLDGSGNWSVPAGGGGGGTIYANQAAAEADGLFGYWRMDTGAGNISFDSTTNGNDERYATKSSC